MLIFEHSSPDRKCGAQIPSDRQSEKAKQAASDIPDQFKRKQRAGFAGSI